MLKEIVESFDAVTGWSVMAFAKRYRLTLPHTYVEFLLRYNGGRPVPPCFPICGHPSQPFDGLQFFFGLRARSPSYDLESVLIGFSTRIAERHIARRMHWHWRLRVPRLEKDYTLGGILGFSPVLERWDVARNQSVSDSEQL